MPVNAVPADNLPDVAVKFSRNAALSLPANVNWNNISFDTIVWQRGGTFQTGTDPFTVQTPGIYELNFAVGLGGGTISQDQAFAAAFRVNAGPSPSIQLNQSVAAFGIGYSLRDIRRLNLNDTVNVAMLFTGGGNITLQTQPERRARLTIRRIGA